MESGIRCIILLAFISGQILWCCACSVFESVCFLLDVCLLRVCLHDCVSPFPSYSVEHVWWEDHVDVEAPLRELRAGNPAPRAPSRSREAASVSSRSVRSVQSSTEKGERAGGEARPAPAPLSHRAPPAVSKREPVAPPSPPSPQPEPAPPSPTTFKIPLRVVIDSGAGVCGCSCVCSRRQCCCCQC